jgi:membrane-anchored protein YejM (alkaline phosphatase superfamily)
MDRNRLIIVWINLLTISFCVKTVQAKSPNVLFIVIDDLRPAALGCYGELKEAYTPNIDKLADRSFRFTSAYAQVIN